MIYLLIFSYDGSKFNGFQRQNSERSVQKDIEVSISKYFKENIVIKGAGRTDKGVHAYMQCAHFECSHDISGLKKYLNKDLNDIKIKAIKKVNDDFHARHSVKEKTYIYKISLFKELDKNYYLNIYANLDIKKMREASKLFIGTHDFKNFVSGERLDYTSTIFDIKITKIFNKIYIKYTGIGFYRYMVRNLTGALIDIGKNKCSFKDIEEMLELITEKRLPTAPPNGLYLKNIKY